MSGVRRHGTGDGQRTYCMTQELYTPWGRVFLPFRRIQLSQVTYCITHDPKTPSGLESAQSCLREKLAHP
jgi:hypothetical protein